MQPELYNLGHVGWQVFGTLTFKSERIPIRVRRSLWFAFVRAIAGKAHVHFSKALWVLREERGERFGRVHLHYLFGGMPSNFACITSCFVQAATWEKLGGGIARVSVFDQALNGLTYLTKCLNAGLAYETGKFGWESSNLTLSHSTQRFLRGCVSRDRQAVKLTQTSSFI